MDKERVKEIQRNAEIFADRCTGEVVKVILPNKDYAFLLETIENQQEEIERLKVVEQAYEALKKAI